MPPRLGHSLRQKHPDLLRQHAHLLQGQSLHIRRAIYPVEQGRFALTHIITFCTLTTWDAEGPLLTLIMIPTCQHSVN